MTKRPVFPVTRELSPRMRMPLSSDIGLWGGVTPAGPTQAPPPDVR
jgi:hypothetical protein